MSKTLKYISIAIILLLVFFFFSSKMKKDENKGDNVEHPKIETIVLKRNISGHILPSKEVQIKSQVSGILKKTYVNVGDEVKIGDRIALIEIVANPATLESARKNYNIAKINFKNEELNYNRNMGLYKKGVISRSDFEENEQEYLLAKEEMLSANEQLSISQKGFSNNQKISNVIKSTVSGTILDLPLKEGASIIERNTFRDGSNVAVIADLKKILFKGKINENDILFLKDSMNFSLFIGALQNLKVNGTLKNISPKGIEENGIMKFDFEAKVHIPKVDQHLIRSGFTAVAELYLKERKNVLVVQEQNVIFENDSTFVDLLVNENQFERTYVETGISDGIKIEISKGLTKEDKIKILDE